MPQDTGGILNLKKPVGSDDIRLQTIGIDLPYNFQKIDDAFTAHQAESAQKHITESGENSNGRYIKFDTGMIMQWHSEVFTQGSETTKDRLYALPMAFPNECVSLVASLGPHQHAVWVSEGYLNCFAEKDRVRIVQRYGLTEGRAYCISYTAIGY